jgi:hypothetical protein
MTTAVEAAAEKYRSFCHACTRLGVLVATKNVGNSLKSLKILSHTVLEYCGYTTLRTRNRQIWKCVWPKIVMSYKNVLYDLNTEFSTKFSTTSVYTQL